MSFLAWVDFDHADRTRVRQIMDLFAEKDTRDELGLGSIRDALADLMFPGTSTIQTRLRYMFFVPWIYDDMRKVKGSAQDRVAAARKAEIRLIDALIKGGEQNLVIGSEARAGLKRLPSDVYWAGLAAVGIRRFEGSRGDYLARATSLGQAEDEDANPARPWAAGLPKAPDGWLETIDFQLTSEEASFFKDRLAVSCTDSVLTELSRAADADDCRMVWEHPLQAGWSPRNKDLVRNARLLSDLMHGAALLYNLLLSQLAEARQAVPGPDWETKVQEYRNALKAWRTESNLADLQAWNLSELWDFSDSTTHRVTAQTRRFVTEWLQLVNEAAFDPAENPAAHQIIETRETRLKGGKSRFRNPAALVRWQGASGIGRLNYRWPIVARHLKDLASVD